VCLFHVIERSSAAHAVASAGFSALDFPSRRENGPFNTDSLDAIYVNTQGVES